MPADVADSQRRFVVFSPRVVKFMLAFSWWDATSISPKGPGMGFSRMRSRLSCAALAFCAAAAGCSIYMQTPRLDPSGEPICVGPSACPPCRVQPAPPCNSIDAEFGCPPPSIGPAGGRRMLTTTVLHQSNLAPHVGWSVRYSIVGGPPAGFAPDGAQVVEATTNAAGQASVEIFQKQPARGTNNISIQIIRPEGPGQPRWIVGTGSALATWTAANVSVRKTGPATIVVGGTATYRIEVCNPGDLLARDVLLTDEIPDSFSYLNSSPPGEVAGKQIQWRLGNFAPGQRQCIELCFRAVQAGSVANCAQVTAAGGLTATDCATTNVCPATSVSPPASASPSPIIHPPTSAGPPPTASLPSIDVQVVGPVPATVAVGSSVKFNIVIENRGQVVASGLTLKDRFQPGLEFPDHPSPIEKDLPNLAPGETKRVGLTFRVTRPGLLCHTAQVLSRQTVAASAEGCVTAVESPGGLPSDRGPILPRPSEPLFLKVEVSGPARGAVGEDVEFSIAIANTTSRELTDVKVVYSADFGLLPKLASVPPKRRDGDLVWTLASLAPGKTEKLAVGCRCTAASPRACSRVTAASREDARGEGAACIEIREEKRPTPPVAASGLSLTVTCWHKPVAVGKDALFLVNVRNGGTTAEKSLVLTATLPAAMALVPLGTHGPATTEYVPKDQVLQFTPLKELAPGETATYRITLLAKQKGVFHLAVDLSGGGLAQPIHGDEAAEVF